MTWDPEFEELMPHTLKWEKLSRHPSGKPIRDGYGNQSFDAVVEVKCRYLKKIKMVRGPDGNQAVSSSQAWTAGVFGISTEDRIEVPGGKKPPILAVELIPDEDGPHHEKVFFA